METPEPPTIEDMVNAGCALAGKLDPFDPNPATVGTGVGYGSLIDWTARAIEPLPEITYPFAAFKAVVSLLAAARDGVATAANFVCQQAKGEGTYHDLAEDLGGALTDRWDDMTNAQKVVTIAVGSAVILTGLMMLAML